MSPRPGLDGVKLISGDKCLGVLEAVGVYPDAKHEHCTVHFTGTFSQSFPNENCGQDAQGDPRPGEQGRLPEEGERGGGNTPGHASA